MILASVRERVRYDVRGKVTLSDVLFTKQVHFIDMVMELPVLISSPRDAESTSM